MDPFRACGCVLLRMDPGARTLDCDGLMVFSSETPDVAAEEQQFFHWKSVHYLFNNGEPTVTTGDVCISLKHSTSRGAMGCLQPTPLSFGRWPSCVHPVAIQYSK